MKDAKAADMDQAPAAAHPQAMSRKVCRLCGANKLQLVLDLKPIPLSESHPKSREESLKLQRYPVSVFMCEACGHVQQLSHLAPETIWSDYTYRTRNAVGMVAHMKSIHDHVVRLLGKRPGELCVDVGSNDGTFLSFFKEGGWKVLGVDPAPQISREANEAGIPTLTTTLTPQVAGEIVAKHGKAAVVSALNAFAHADNLDEMLTAIGEILAPDGMFVFEVQYLADIIDKMLIPTFFHEHLSHHSLLPLQAFLKKIDLKVVDLYRSPNQNGSLIGFCVRASNPMPELESVGDLIRYEQERRITSVGTMRAFSARIASLAAEVRAFLEAEHAAGRKIVGWGAARSAPTILTQFGIGEFLTRVIDDDPARSGAYIPGHGLPIEASASIESDPPDYIIVLAWAHQDHIIRQNQRLLAHGVKFVKYFPAFEIVG